MINKGTYDKLSWVDALKARQAKREFDGTEKETTENVLERTVEAAFKVPTSEPTTPQKVDAAAKDIQQNEAAKKVAGETQQIKEKLASREIDPVALGVVSKEEWAKASDPTWTESVAKKAAMKYEKQLKASWEKKAMEPQQAAKGFDPATSMDGKIIPSFSPTEESQGRINRVPLNAASILNPNRIDELAKAKNEHDESVKAIREAQKTREAAKPAPADIPKDLTPMRGGKVVSSGAANESSAFIHRVPKDQISIMDKAETSEQMKDKLAARIPDTRTEIREANERHREAIQGKKQEDKSWDQVSKPLTSTEIQKRLINLWMPPKPEKK